MTVRFQRHGICSEDNQSTAIAVGYRTHTPDHVARAVSGALRAWFHPEPDPRHLPPPRAHFQSPSLSVERTGCSSHLLAWSSPFSPASRARSAVPPPLLYLAICSELARERLLALDNGFHQLVIPVRLVDRGGLADRLLAQVAHLARDTKDDEALQRGGDVICTREGVDSQDDKNTEQDDIGVMGIDY